MFFLFFYFLDWSHFDQISISIRETIVDFINNTDEQILIENNLENRLDNNGLNLSNSSISLMSNTSNDLSEENINSSNDIININNNQEHNFRRLRRVQNNYQRNVLEDLLGVFPF